MRKQSILEEKLILHYKDQEKYQNLLAKAKKKLPELYSVLCNLVDEVLIN